MGVDGFEQMVEVKQIRVGNREIKVHSLIIMILMPLEIPLNMIIKDMRDDLCLKSVRQMF